MKIILRKAAQSDLKNMVRYGAQEFGERVAIRYYRELTNRLKLLEANPMMGSPFKELRSKDYRKLMSGNHVILYKIADDNIVVERIMDARQNWQALRFD